MQQSCGQQMPVNNVCVRSMSATWYGIRGNDHNVGGVSLWFPFQNDISHAGLKYSENCGCLKILHLVRSQIEYKY